LLAGAECATGPCCDIQSTFGDPSRTTCKLKQSGSVCREAGNSCDLPEYCSGESEWCPADVFKTDGEVCYTREGYKSHCIRGGCNAPDEWCRVLWGPTGLAAGPDCVAHNMIRDANNAIDKVANCGRLRPRGDERWREMDQWPSKACNDWRVPFAISHHIYSAIFACNGTVCLSCSKTVVGKSDHSFSYLKLISYLNGLLKRQEETLNYLLLSLDRDGL
uniref:Disintegrin domain-containing protein n=1 Tax=Hydatigena taeniaeformis TaxID=6205 RepID=A0A0R3X8K3_HYDTA